MLKKLKFLAMSAFFIGTFILPITADAATINDSVCQGANLSFSGSTTRQAGESEEAFKKRTCQADQSGDVNNLISDIVNILSVIVGIVAVIMIIVGGFKYITSGGDSNKVSSAKNTILYAIIGLIIVALAQFIVRFVLSKAKTATT